eukprot:359937-Chlamydomonas_euryale.AAC.17
MERMGPWLVRACALQCGGLHTLTRSAFRRPSLRIASRHSSRLGSCVSASGASLARWLLSSAAPDGSQRTCASGSAAQAGSNVLIQRWTEVAWNIDFTFQSTP